MKLLYSLCDRTLKKVIFLFLCFFVFVRPCLAQIFINEVLPDPSGDENQDEWVELYNSGDTQDVNGWKLHDGSGHELIISSDKTGSGNTTISNNSWLVIYRRGASFSLNNSGDEAVKLYDASSSAQLIDSMTYSGSSEEHTWGRTPDGSSTWTANLTKTPGAANQILPSPSPSPSSQATYKINEPKNSDNAPLSEVKIYVDDKYIGYYAARTLIFCDECHCDPDKQVDCGFGMHMIKLEKDGYNSWYAPETLFFSGFDDSVDPVLTTGSSGDSGSSSQTSPSPSPKISPSPKASKKPSPSPSPKESTSPSPSAEVFSHEKNEEATVAGAQTHNSKFKPSLPQLIIASGILLMLISSFPFLKPKIMDLIGKFKKEPSITNY